MKLFKTFLMVGLLELVMAATGFCHFGGVNPEGDCLRAESIILASYDPKRSEPLLIKEYLYGKNSSAAGLGLLEIRARARFSHQCDLIIFAYYPKSTGDGVGALSEMGDNAIFYLVKENEILVPEGQNVPFDELKKWIKAKGETVQPINR